MKEILPWNALPEAESLTEEAKEQIFRFYELLTRENEVQNLTRLSSPEDFIDGHLADCVHLDRSGFLGASVLDLGSGGGVPGLLTASFDQRSWALVDSEKKKADFLGRAAEELGIADRIQVSADRIERAVNELKPKTIVARAVGPISRIYSWIAKCSTWNRIVLLKGPSWPEEWEAFPSSFKKKLTIAGQVEYRTPLTQKTRVIVALDRIKKGPAVFHVEHDASRS